MPVLLVVADETRRARWAADLVERGHRVTALGSEDEARRFLRAFTPTIVVYHARDDGDDSRAFLYELSGRDDVPPLRLVVLSGSAGATRLAEACGFLVLDEAVDATRVVSEIGRLAPESIKIKTRGR